MPLYGCCNGGIQWIRRGLATGGNRGGDGEGRPGKGRGYQRRERAREAIPARLAAGSLVAAVVRKRKRPRSHRNSLDLFP
jgi:hypothetical protein